ncbi:MAG: hypothetical protein KatS3mg129_3252 [Leptospiraceae bacterium]|nr:MAG: hypothetical protein KatS3mg129_3252 [Leptospiraceae bacterium]
MGKSLQGANGILVLGSLLFAYLKRYENKEIAHNSLPEIFLKNLSIELQILFESFDGSMLISAIIGLIEESTNILYYINFEHPYPIIFRENKAFFIGEKHIHRKLGTPSIFQEEIIIQIFSLKENDILIIGSDGKDDIEIESNGNRFINRDKNFFLKIVEQSQGDFQKIIDQLHIAGNFKDDVSILYFKNLFLNPNYHIYLEEKLHIVKKSIKNALLNKNYENVYHFIQAILHEFYHDNDILLYYFYTLKQLKQYQKAIEIGNILLLRNIDNPIIYELLIICYKNINHTNKIQEIYHKLKEKFPYYKISEKIEKEIRLLNLL